jgi:hypothetical protein
MNKKRFLAYSTSLLFLTEMYVSPLNTHPLFQHISFSPFYFPLLLYLPFFSVAIMYSFLSYSTKREEKSYETEGNKKLNSVSALRHVSYFPQLLDSQ